MISLIILGIIFLYAIISYNTLTRKEQCRQRFRFDRCHAEKRFDLIPNLVATVQQYAKHEEETFTSKSTNLRTKSYDSLTAEEKQILTKHSCC